jgi:FMN phosphatase YigB (HAD superfamily)
MKILKPENIDFNSISTILLDWGGVITNINPQATIRLFEKIGHTSFAEYFKDTHDDLFIRFEKGLAKPDEIYRRLTEEIGHPVHVNLLNNALCAMLSDTPAARIEILKKLRNRFQLILLSNTNILHTTYYTNHLQHNQGVNFPALFHKVYYSYKIGMRKPDREIFEFVIADAKLDTWRTLFIDDTERNITVAASLGFQVFHLSDAYTMENIFSAI